MRVTRKIFTRAVAKLFFLIDFPEIFSFASFVFFFFFYLFFEIKNIYSDTHLITRGRMIKKCSPGRFPETILLFLSLLLPTVIAFAIS